MIGPFEVVWSRLAMRCWMALSYADALAVSRAVRRFAEGGGGHVVYVDGEMLLFVGVHAVVILVDGDTMHIDRVRRA